MSSDHEAVYMMRASDDGEWVRPKQASVAIFEAVTDETALDAESLDGIDAYVDGDELREVIDGIGDDVTFTVEGYRVTVTADGEIKIAE
ncbi:MAG: HalOD1 output domain-containing protein [Halovenus sp.]